LGVSRCRDCGAPTYTRIFRRWNSDGTVTGRLSSGVRICHIEAGEVCSLVRGISEKIGYPIDRIVVEGERKAARNITNETLASGHGILSVLARSPGGTPVTLKMSLDVSRSVGYGSPEVLRYIRGKEFDVRVDNPFCVPVVVGDIWGNFESIHRITAGVESEESDDSVTIHLRKLSDEVIEEHPGRLALKKMATMTGEVAFDRCERCGIPRDVTRSIEWDVERGQVTSRKTGRREVTIMVEAVNAIINELTEELGDEIPVMVEQVEQDYIAGVMSGSSMPATTRDYGILLDELRIMGMGNPVTVEKTDNTLSVVINNPFCEPLLAGRVGGYYRALEKVKPEVKWTPDTRGSMTIEVKPAGAGS